MLKYDDCIGIVACSNGIDIKKKIDLVNLEAVLINLGVKVVYAETIYIKHSIFNGSNKEKADSLMKLYLNPKIKAIFDISGGDLANGILDYLDYKLIKKNYKPFFGYSDLTVVLNALYCKTYMETYNYQLKNLIGNYSEKQIEMFKSTFIDGNEDLYKLKYDWIQGSKMEGVLIGGNIRCFLKLAGTDFIPNFKNKIILLESMSGDIPKMVTYLNQYKQMGVFNNVNGIILGTFTQMDRNNYKPDIIDIIKSVVGNDIPIVRTKDIGHGDDSKCIAIGKRISISKSKG